MGKLHLIKAEIDADPLTRGYAGMTNQQVADDLNTAYRSVDVDSITPELLISNIKAHTHWPDINDTLTGDDLIKSLARMIRELAYLMILHSLTNIPINAQWVQAYLNGNSGIFQTPAQQATDDAIDALKSGMITRAQELNLGKVEEGDVAGARAL